ncbi:MAG: tRNA adenosine(34) deaminase TadA [Kiritimatiellia bacterium]
MIIDFKSREHYMREALKEARAAFDEGEVPAGCVIVTTAQTDKFPAGSIIARSHNQVELLKDPTAHAEMIAITQAASAIGDWRLADTALYVTKEPCAMCAGAIVLARVPEVIFGAPDPRRGAAGSAFQILDSPSLNHRSQIVSGILSDECSSLLTAFFQPKREK